MSKTSAATAPTIEPTTSTTAALVLLMVLVFTWGSITSLNDILIPHLKAIFTLSYAEAMMVQFMFFLAYVIFSYPSGRLIESIGYKRTIIVGLLVIACGALLFIPAANALSFRLFLIGSSTLAAGMTLLQVSVNPYISVLGAPETSAARVNMAGVFNSFGTTVAPYVGGLVILDTAPLRADGPSGISGVQLHAYKLAQAASVKVPYFLIAAVLVLFSLIVARFKLPTLVALGDASRDDRSSNSLWKDRHLKYGVVAIFLYVGAEVTIGSLLASYITQPQIGNITLQAAAKYLSFYWSGLLVGRFLGATALRRIPSHRALAVAGVAALSLAIFSIITHGMWAVWSVVLIGLCHSIMWPDIFTLAIDGLGPLTNRGSSLLIAGTGLGGAVIPVVQGVVADHIGIHHSFVVIAVSYLFIIFYGLRGYKPSNATAGDRR